ncbi:MAG: hypothetical protein H3C64_08615 [Candidatus Kuenenia stuttgartiensis]|nr:hypothetical protein [Candidatus Kuenenia stuttgartiensis]
MKYTKFFIIAAIFLSFPSSGLGTQLFEKLQLRMEERMKPCYPGYLKIYFHASLNL